jgi:tRNA nucleotidyltransferase (CCA-adding enzyme)|tara:strand:- start:308 stop:1558 length:1251 start_codon:yes stop_codon:yes gene_type:complete
MSEIINLASLIEKHLPPELISFIKQASALAEIKSDRLYLVGGIVRDLLLGKASLDLDLVVEGDAIALARALMTDNPAKIIVHQRFGTAKLQFSEWSVDIATTRRESYARPGALPTVKSGSIINDLFRRDFTNNAMAIKLNSDSYGHLIDLYGGHDDLKHKLIRILHEQSFIDDATRIWRSLRYEQRLGFKLELNTLRLLKRDIPMLKTISGDRIRYELECVLKEQYPERIFGRAYELGVLKSLHPSLKGNDWFEKKFKQARQLSLPDRPPLGLYLALMTYPLTTQETEQFIVYLRLPKSLAQTLLDTSGIKAQLALLVDPRLPPSGIYHLLHSYSPQAVTASLLASDSLVVKEHIQLFLAKLRYMRPALNGNDLTKMGVPIGPNIKEILNLLHNARLDEKVISKQGEEEMVREWIN